MNDKDDKIVSEIFEMVQNLIEKHVTKYEEKMLAHQGYIYHTLSSIFLGVSLQIKSILDKKSDDTALIKQHIYSAFHFKNNSEYRIKNTKTN